MGYSELLLRGRVAYLQACVGLQALPVACEEGWGIYSEGKAFFWAVNKIVGEGMSE